jgi:hypothetical protein
MSDDYDHIDQEMVDMLDSYEEFSYDIKLTEPELRAVLRSRTTDLHHILRESPQSVDTLSQIAQSISEICDKLPSEEIEEDTSEDDVPEEEDEEE